MHYGILVILSAEDGSNGAPIEKRVESLMEPHGPSGASHWDWYQIGGRWTGHFDGYKPDEDAQNIETCDLCGGTGDRASFRHEPKDDQHPTGCNGCLGKGKRVKWPTQWAKHCGDIVPVSALTDEHMKIHAVCAEQGWFARERFIPWRMKFVEQEMPPLEWLKSEYSEGHAVIVDAHN